MPILQVKTNVSKQSIPDDFLADMSETMSKMLGKPLKFISVYINPDQMMSFGGTTEPCALCTLDSIGKISLEDNEEYTKVITEKLSALGVAPDRMYIFFTDLARENVGWNSKTFASKPKAS